MFLETQRLRWNSMSKKIDRREEQLVERTRHEKKTFGHKLRLFLGWLIVLVTIAIGAVIVWNYATIESVSVSGTDLYEDVAIKEQVIKGEYSWNTLYVFAQSKIEEPESLPFIESMKVSLTGIHKLKITVYEKEISGYVYIDETGQNAYFNKNGEVVEVSSRIIDGISIVEGLELENVVVGEQLPVSDTSLFKALLSLNSILRKHSMVPTSLTIIANGDYTMKFNEVVVRFGDTNDLNGKIAALEKILPEVEDKEGTLHMEDWKNVDSSITFEPN